MGGWERQHIHVSHYRNVGCYLPRRSNALSLNRKWYLLVVLFFFLKCSPEKIRDTSKGVGGQLIFQRHHFLWNDSCLLEKLSSCFTCRPFPCCIVLVMKREAHLARALCKVEDAPCYYNFRPRGKPEAPKDESKLQGKSWGNGGIQRFLTYLSSCSPDNDSLGDFNRSVYLGMNTR